MKWIYILKCEDDYFYVGQTMRLYTRFWEHKSGNGSLNTSIYKPENIVAIYKINIISNFIKYNNLIENEYDNSNILKFWDTTEDESYNFIAENYITECLMINRNDWTKIRGGKYTRFDIDYKFPINVNIKDLPLCKCGLPCDIKKNKDILFFRCAKKNMWEDLKNKFKINEEPCPFYMKYTKTKDNDFKLKLNEYRNTLKELFKKSSHWLNNIEIYDKEGCIDCREDNNLLTWNDNKIRLCINCFKYNNDELSQKYVRKCLINI